MRTAWGAEPVRFTSGPARVAVVELFTSEGCSSCPPAERWLAALKDDPGLWRDFVPLSFHVDYWDNLGWLDRFATPAFTQREYAYAAAWGTSSVYTPCFVRDGAEWKPGAGDGPAGGSPGVLTVQLREPGAGWVVFTPVAGVRGEPGAGWAVEVALLGGGFASQVTAGENRGATLRHEFVVLALVERPLVSSADGKTLRADFTLPAPTVAGAGREAIAAWVTRRGSLAPIQAAGGWLP